MNKQELTAQLNLDEKSLDVVLESVGIAKNLQDYNDESLKMIQALQEIRKDSKVKSWTEAVVIYRKPIQQAQLKEITLRHAIGDERIPEILTLLKLKLGTLTDEHFGQFLEVCQQLQQNMDLPIVAQGVLNKAKAAKAKPMPELVQPPESDKKPSESAIAVVDRGVGIPVVSDTPKALMFEIPEKASEDMESLAKTSTVEMAQEYIKGAATQILDQDPQEAFRQGQQYGQNLVEKARHDYLQGPEASEMVGHIIAQVKKNLGQQS
jgi:hypothetical protein